MWKNWNPFKKRQELPSINNNKGSSSGVTPGNDCIVGVQTSGKENTNTNFSHTDDLSGLPSSVLNSHHGLFRDDRNQSSYSANNTNISSQTFKNHNASYNSSSTTTRTSPPKKATKVFRSQSLSLSRVRESPNQNPQKNLTSQFRSSSSQPRKDAKPYIFSGVHGPLLSSPIIPKVRKALENNAGLRSPSTSKPPVGRNPINRSSSMKHGPLNPAKSLAGQVPWVRLKRRGSILLADIVSGNMPQSPNRVKLAAPQDSYMLPAAPSFKTTPLIVTTDSGQRTTVDTQTVVSALREKRKRNNGSQVEESLSDDLWQNNIKRRRQDSSQSNASSVSIPPMPETLPNLMAGSNSSLLHIENLSDQRPSTVPAMDSFINHHHQGLGGSSEVSVGQSCQVTPRGGNRRVLRGIQSSLSSSMRARTNASILQQGGIDLKRIREAPGVNRRMSFNSDVSMLDQGSICEEPKTKVSRQTAHPNISMANEVSKESTIPKTDTVSSSTSEYDKDEQTSSSTTVSTPTKKKIAEGVVLRRQNMSLGNTSSPIRLFKPPPKSTLVSATDFEEDRQKEYQRRVLDLLEDEPEPESSKETSKSASVNVSAALTANTVTTSSVTTTSSAAITTSLESLSKLVQSTAPASTKSSAVSSSPTITVGGAVTLTQLLSAEDGPKTSSVTSLNTVSSGIGLSLSGGLMTTPSSLKPAVSISAAPVSTSITTSPSSVTGGFSFGSNDSTQQKLSGSLGSGLGANTTNGLTTSLQTSTSVSNTGGFSFDVSSSVAAKPKATSFNFASGASLNAAVPSTLSGFQLSNTVTTTAQNFQLTSPISTTNESTTSKSISTTGVSGMFSFGAPASSSVSAAVTSSSPASATLSVFGANPSQISSSSNIATSFGAISNTAPTTVTPTPAFTGFGVTQIQSQTASSFLSSSIATNINTSAIPPVSTLASVTTTPAFNFGIATSAPAQGGINASSVGVFGATSPPAYSAASGFGGFGTKTSTAAQQAPAAQVTGFGGFGTGTSLPVCTASQTSNIFSSTSSLNSSTGLGFNPQQSTSATPIAGSAPTPNNASTFVFGQASTTTTASSNTGAFSFSVNTAATTVSSTTSNSAAFNFGQTSATASNASTPFTFGSSTTVASNTAPFGNITVSKSNNPFGVTQTTTSSTASATPVFGSTSNPFGAPTTTTAAPVFGSAPAPSFGTSSPASFNFGNNQNQQSTTFGQSSQNQPFTFGSTPSANESQTKPPGSVFGGSNAGSVSSPFGGAQPTAGLFGSSNQTPTAFGAQTTQPSTTTSFGTSGFGTAPKPSAFGSASQTTAFGIAQNSAFGVGSPQTQSTLFGATTPSKPIGSTTPFGGSTASTTSFSGATSPPAFNFGGSQPQQSNAFGVSQPQQNNAFGNSQPQQPAAFGASQPQQNSAFGGSQNQQNNAFGQPQQNNAFGGSLPQQNNAFGATQPQQSAFGTPSTNSTPGAGAFNFGATQPSNPSTGFNFGASTPKPPAPGGFNFNAAAGSGPSFNFGAAAPSTPNTNMFTPPAPGSVARPRAAASRRGNRTRGPRR